MTPGGAEQTESGKKVFKRRRPKGSGLFSQKQPELLFYRRAALSTKKGFIRKRTEGLQRPHVPYIEPLMKFFHDSIDCERVLEIDRQELILQDDFSIFQLYGIVCDDGKGTAKGLALTDFQANTNKFFNVKFSYKEIKMAMIRQFPISYAGRVENMRYNDFEKLLKPRSKKFASYVKRKIQLEKHGGGDDTEADMNVQTDIGVTAKTHIMVGKFFEDLLQLENQLELSRKYKLATINIKDAFAVIDMDRKGYATLADYYTFFEEYYTDEMPISSEEIDYLFKRHDKEKLGRVSEAVFLKELMPIDDYIIID